MKNFLKLFKTVLPFLVVFAIILSFFWKVIFLRMVPIPADFVAGVYYPWLDYKWGYEVGVPVKNPITTDVVSFTYPMQMLAIDMLKKGEIPLWNPYILTGTPLLANFQSAPFSPTNFVYFIFDKLTGWGIQIILQHVLAAIFTFFLLRHWKVSRLGAVVGGIVFAFSGFNLIWSQWNGHTLAAAFIPLILLFEDKWLVNGKWWNGFLLSLLLALQMLAGYPQVVLYLFVAMGVLWLVRFSVNKVYFLRTLLLGIFLILGLGLVSFQILPGAELLNLSQRKIEPLPYEWAFLPLKKIITFVAPDFFGNHATKNYWGPQDYTSNTGFVGVVASIFAVLSLAATKKKKEILFSFLLLVVSLLFAFPTFVSIFFWQNGILGLQAASAHRALILFNLAVALLASFGVDEFLKQKKIKIWLPILYPGLILFGYFLYAAIFFFLSRNSPDLYPPLIRGISKYVVALRNLAIPLSVFFSTVFLIWFSGRFSFIKKKLIVLPIILMMIFEIFWFGWKFTPFSERKLVFPETPILSFLTEKTPPFRVTGADVIPINMRMPYKLESLEGYDAVYPLYAAKFVAVANSKKVDAEPQGRYATVLGVPSDLLDLVNTKYYLALKLGKGKEPSPEGKVPTTFNQKGLEKVFEDKTVAIIESKNVLPRAKMYYQWEIIFNDEEALKRILTKDFLQEDILILNDQVKADQSTAQKVDSSVEYLNYQENYSELKIKTAQKGFLFVSDLFYPGWKAFLDGKEISIYRANYAFRAVEVPQGEHLLKFEYKPASFFNGLKVSLLSLIILSLLAFGLMILGKGKFGRYTLRS